MPDFHNLFILLANSKIAVALGIVVALIWFLKHRSNAKKSGTVSDKGSFGITKSSVMGLITHSAALYITLILLCASFTGIETVTTIIKDGFGELELQLALLACCYESLSSTVKVIVGSSPA